MNGFNLVGRIRPVYKGMWTANTAYTILETVTSADNHTAYIATKDVPIGIPLSNEDYWGVLVDVRDLSGRDGGYIIPEIRDVGGGYINISYTPSDPNMDFIAMGDLIKLPAGPQGPKGDQGEVGPQGPSGPAGPTGPRGEQGPAGEGGAKGDTGVGIAQIVVHDSSDTGGSNRVEIVLTDGTSTSFFVQNGKDGAQGDTGPAGPAGADGEKGDKGDKGDTGAQGPKGDTGATGPQGEQGPKGDTGAQGPRGEKGPQGDTGLAGSDGVGIASVRQTTTSINDEGNNVITVTLTDGTTSKFTVRNGSKGSAGDTGPAGADGAKGDKGDTGDTGAQGPKGDKGDTGATGPAGYTPVKGTDYWTGADQEAIMQQVIAALGTPVFGTVDVDNNIVLTGELVDGDYTIRYEAADGTTTVIGTLEIGGTAAYINVLDTVGWLENKRISTSSGYAERDNEGTDLTGYIPVSTGDVIRMKNVTMPQTSTGYDNQVYYYDNSKVGKGGASIVPPNYDSVADSAGNIIQFKVGSAWTTNGTGFIRIGTANIDSTSVITINEVIE